MTAYCCGIGSRIDDIDNALSLAKMPTGAHVIELSCGDGRDAAEILKRVSDYIGIDPSVGLLNLARQSNPMGRLTPP